MSSWPSLPFKQNVSEFNRLNLSDLAGSLEPFLTSLTGPTGHSGIGTTGPTGSQGPTGNVSSVYVSVFNNTAAPGTTLSASTDTNAFATSSVIYSQPSNIFNTSLGQFTAPLAGFYSLKYVTTIQNAFNQNSPIQNSISKNGTKIVTTYFNPSTGGNIEQSFSQVADLQLNQNDIIKFIINPQLNNNINLVSDILSPYTTYASIFKFA
jgi:hypothetical protein